MSWDLRTPRYQLYQPPGEPPRIKPGWLILGGLAIFLVLCCCCSAIGLLWWRGDLKPPSLPALPNLGGARSTSSASTTRTPTLVPDKPIPLRTRVVSENGLEVTVVN